MLTKQYPWLSRAHQHIETLKKSNHLPHALLITGTESIGKFVFVMDAIKTLLCDKNGCGGCHLCRMIDADMTNVVNEKDSKDLLIRRSHYPNLVYCHREITKTGKRSNYIRIDQIRALCDVLVKSADALQIGLIYYADEMTLGAANSLLKTLEEPRDNTLIILLAHKNENVPITIRSRCQHIHLSSDYSDHTKTWLKTHISLADDTTIEQMLKLANGVPLKVLEWSENNAFEQHKLWREKWLKIALNPTEVSDISLFKDTQLLALLYLQQLLIEAIKMQLAQQPNEGDELNYILSKADIKHIFLLLQDITHVVGLFHTQANQSLLFNTIVIIWSHITHLKSYPAMLPH